MKLINESSDSYNHKNIVDIFVIDGGFVLHKIKWQHGVPFAEVTQQYMSFVVRHLSKNSIVTSHGFGNGPCTKDEEHRRNIQKSSPDIVFDERNAAYYNQSVFLANECNTEYFVQFLYSRFKSAGYLVNQAYDDSDRLIVRTALDFAHSG